MRADARERMRESGCERGFLSLCLSIYLSDVLNLGSDRSHDKWERMHESGCMRADARERMHESGCESGFSGVDTSLAHLIGSDKSHDLESAPASALVPCDLY